MNKLLSELNVLYIKLHNYHYNVIGHDFKESHVFLEEEYNAIHEIIDEVAEHIKMDDKFPMARMVDYLENSDIKEVESKNYTSKEIYNALLVDYKILLNTLDSIHGENVNYDALLDEVREHLIKLIWMYRAFTS